MSDQDVRPGQIWSDNDPRSAGRTLRVDAIDGGKAVCTILTNSDETQERLDRIYRGKTRNIFASAPQGIYASDRRGRTTRISLSRFRPTSTGYRLIEDAPPEAMEEENQ